MTQSTRNSIYYGTLGLAFVLIAVRIAGYFMTAPHWTKSAYYFAFPLLLIARGVRGNRTQRLTERSSPPPSP